MCWQTRADGSTAYGKILEILVITISAAPPNCDTMGDAIEWSRAHENWLRQFLVLKNGITLEDTFPHLFRLLDPKPFSDLQAMADILST